MTWRRGLILKRLRMLPNRHMCASFASLRTITECLRPIIRLTSSHAVLGEIAPPALMREAATLVLGRRACQHDHILHDAMENSTHAPKET